MIPDAMFLHLAAGFGKPSADELVLLKQLQRARFQDGHTANLYELAVESGFLSPADAAKFEAFVGESPAPEAEPAAEAKAPTKAPSGRVKAPSGRVKAPSGRVKAPSGRTGVKAPSGRTGVKAPSGRTGVKAPSGRTGVKAPSGRTGVKAPSGRTGVKAPSGRTGVSRRASSRVGRASGRNPHNEASGLPPSRSPLIPVALGAVVVLCVAGAFLISRSGKSTQADDPSVATVEPAESLTPGQYMERARAERASLLARLERGHDETALDDLERLAIKWAEVPAAAEALKELDVIRADFLVEYGRRRGYDRRLNMDPADKPSEPDPADEDDDPIPPPLNGFPDSEDDPDPQPPPAQPPVAPLVPDPVAPVTPDPVDPVAPDPQPEDRDPKPAEPGPTSDPKPPELPTPEPVSPDDDPRVDLVPSADFARALIAFAGEKDAELRTLSEALTVAKDPLEGAVRGLVAFRAAEFGKAHALLAPVAGLDSWLRETYLRAGLVLGHFDAVRKDMHANPKGVDPVLRTLAFGPFYEAYPHAAAALEQITPGGHYRVVTDLGLTPRAIEELDQKLASASPKTRENLIRRTQKKHVSLGMLAAMMDKAYSAYDKLFGIDRACEVVPTVYLFSDSSAFASFSRKLEVGDTENTLGYYLPYYRVLTFYEEKEPKAGTLSLETQDTLMHETFHQWLHLYVKDAPPWFNEGLAEYFGLCRLERTRLTYGLVPAMTGATRLAHIRDSLTGEGYSEPWPLSRLITADHRQFMSSHPGLNYAHAWSFVHYLTSNASGRKRLRVYFKGLRDNVPPDRLYRKVFGDVPAATLQSNWRTYTLQLKPS